MQIIGVLMGIMVVGLGACAKHSGGTPSGASAGLPYLGTPNLCSQSSSSAGIVVPSYKMTVAQGVTDSVTSSQAGAVSHVHSFVKKGLLMKVGPTDPNKVHTLFVTMQQKDPAAATSYVLSKAGGASAVKNLSLSEFEEQFCHPDSALAQDVENLKAAGFSIVRPGRSSMTITGTTEQINKFFGTVVTDYQTPTGDAVYANNSELTFSQQSLIKAVVGLNNIPKLKRTGGSKALSQLVNVGTSNLPSLTPTDIIKAYGLTNSVKKLDGTGQTVAIVSMTSYDPKDVNSYLNKFYNNKTLGAGQLKNVYFGGVTSSVNVVDSEEPILDISMVLALAPATNILVYQVNPDAQTPANVLSMYQQVLSDAKASVLTTSWTYAESEVDEALIESEVTVFIQMAVAGITVFSATGDFGDYANIYNNNVNNLEKGNCASNTAGCAAQDPAIHPFVTGVGGTILSINADSSYKSEATWGPATAKSATPVLTGGSGGGISTYYQIPCFQKQISQTSSGMSTTMRNVPDVALNASFPYAYFFNGVLSFVGGTSAAAPLWAAFTALVNQQRQNDGKSSIGLLNIYLYNVSLTSQYASLFHDIADGNSNGYYVSVTGYDLATGLGTFIGDPLLNYLASL
jgi:kumamolisin